MNVCYFAIVAESPGGITPPAPTAESFLVGPFDTPDATLAWADARVNSDQVFRIYQGPVDHLDNLVTKARALNVLVDPLD